MQKRGQATLFIILGIIVASLLVLVVALKGQAIISELRKAVTQAEARLPAEKEVMQELQGCIDEKTLEAVTIAGQRGGYITIPEDKILQGPNNPFSNALTVVGSMRVPYWFYEAANGVQKKQVPELKTVEQQLSDYVEKSAAECAPEVASRYNLRVNEKEISVKAAVQTERVSFSIDYPVTLESGSLRLTTGEISSTVNAPLGRMINYGKQLVESKEPFLEERTIDMLVLYDELPYTGAEFTCSTKLWTQTKVKEDFKMIASENIAEIKLTGSANEAKNKYFNWDALRGKNLKANFMYSQAWPTKIEISPSQGELLKGDELNQQIGNEAAAYLNSLFCITNYNFIYNIQYPVLVTLTDTKTGYTLQYATQVIIKNNQPRENKAEFEVQIAQSEICGSKAAQATVNAFKVMPDSSLSPESDVDVKYKCANAICAIGKTDKEGKLTAAFPQCYNGYVMATKEGLLDQKEVFSTNQETEISLLIDPVYTANFDIKVVDSGQERSLREEEQAIIQLTAKDKSYVTSVSQDQKTVSLPPGTYELKTSLITTSPYGITFPKQTVEHCAESPTGILGILGFSTTKCTKTEIPESRMSQVLRGGATQTWNAAGSELSAAKKITFYIPAQKIPANNDELSEVYSSIQTATAKEPTVE